MVERTSNADRNIIDEALTKALNERRASIHVEGVEISIEDILGDFDRFVQQSSFYIRSGYQWPSVTVDRVDLSFLKARTIPLDIPALEASPVEVGKWHEAVNRARERGLPLVESSVEQARRGFFQGSIDAIFGRGRWKLFSSGDPEVTAKSRTGGSVRAMISDGRFFSTERVFGDTQCAKRIPAGSYCFYRDTITPTNALKVYDIEDDEIVKV
jgi:hypothetical protein